MVFNMPRFIRRMIRRRMHPMAEHEAWSWKTRFAVAYAVIAWHAGAYVVYQIMTGNKHWPTTMGITTKEEDEMRPALFFANTLGVSNAKVVRVSGLSLKYKIDELPDTDNNSALPSNSMEVPEVSGAKNLPAPVENNCDTYAS